MRRTGQYRVGTAGVYFLHAAFHQSVSPQYDSTGCVDNIIDQNRGLAFNVTDNVHNFTDIRLRTAFINDLQRGVQEVSKLSCPYYTAMVR
ncbi:hypothetical protein D3C76_1668610 [compost metagenome]